MKHVAPHRWADAAAGHVSADEHAQMGAHAEACPRCAAGRDRITAARAAFADVARAPAPEQRWEQLGARVYWAASQERRSRERTAVRPPRRWLWVAPVVLAAGAVAAFVLTRDADDDAAPEIVAAPTAPLPTDITPIELVAAPKPLTGLVTLAQGDVVSASGPVFTTAVVAGTSIETPSDGRVAIQVDAGTAFALGPDSRLVVSRLDTGAIELHVAGEISVEVARRAPDQRFTVIAGGRVVEVRGTAFEVVHRDGEVEVACRHGVVAVRDVLASPSAATVEVTAGTRWSAADGSALMDTLAPLDAAAVEALIARGPAVLPAWTDVESMRLTTGPVEVRAGRGRAIRVDGMPVGFGALTVRVMSGRHLVEAERAPGTYGAGEWVTTDDTTGAKVAIADAPAKPATSKRAAVETRRRQLQAAVDARRIANCVRDLARQGLADGTHVELEIRVDETGAVNYLNVGDTDLPSANATCVRDVVASVAFPAGPAARWQHRVSF